MKKIMYILLAFLVMLAIMESYTSIKAKNIEKSNLEEVTVIEHGIDLRDLNNR